MNKTLIYVLLCIFLISSVSAEVLLSKEGIVMDSKTDLLVDKVSDISSLELAYKTNNIEVIKDEIFTDLKNNDAYKKEAVFTMDTSKITEEISLEIIFNEVCGKVLSYEVKNTKDNDYKINAKIESEICNDGSFGYKVDWMPKLTIGENILINQEWEFWNATFDISNPNMYYVIINATSINQASFLSGLSDIQIFNLSDNQWIIYNISGNINYSKARVIKALFYGTDGTNARLNGSFVTGLNKIETSELNDVNESGYYFAMTRTLGDASTLEITATFNDTSTNTNVNSWSYVQGGDGSSDEIGINNSGDDKSNPATAQLHIGSANSRASWEIPDGSELNGAQHSGAFNNRDASGKAYFLAKGNVSIVLSGAPATYSIIDFYKNYSVPKFTYSSLALSFSSSFKSWNGSYSSFNITMVTGIDSYNFSSPTGNIITNILSNDTRLFNITIGGNYYTPTYLNYNISSDLNIDRTITQTLSAPTGVFGETSTLTLNLSKLTNQSYNSADLVYNGVVYSSPTQTDYTNYTLFTQSITNSAIGNVSYFWNVSLTDYSNEFNFTTENGSHLVTGNDVSFNIYNINNSVLLNQSVSITMIGDSGAYYHFNTSNGTLFNNSIKSDTYVITFQSSGFSNVVLNEIIVGGSSVIDVYFNSNAVSYLFKTFDYQTLQAVTGVTITMNQNINGVVTTYSQLVTDEFGLANFYLESGVEYNIVAVGYDTNGDAYDVFTGKVTPSLLAPSPYNIYLIKLGTQFVSVFDDVNYQSHVTGNLTNMSVEMIINSLSGSLTAYSIYTLYSGVVYQDSGINSYGETLNFGFPINYSELYFNVTYSFTSTLGDYDTTKLYYINNNSFVANASSNGTMTGMFNDVSALPNTSIVKGFFGIFIIIMLAIIGYRLSSNPMAGMFMGGVGVGITWYWALLPATYCMISLLLIGLIAISRDDSVGYG